MGRRSAALHESGHLLRLLSVRKVSQCSSGLYGIKRDGLQETPRSHPTDEFRHRLGRQGLSHASWNVVACINRVEQMRSFTPQTPSGAQKARFARDDNGSGTALRVHDFNQEIRAKQATNVEANYWDRKFLQLRM